MATKTQESKPKRRRGVVYIIDFCHKYEVEVHLPFDPANLFKWPRRRKPKTEPAVDLDSQYDALLRSEMPSPTPSSQKTTDAGACNLDFDDVCPTCNFEELERELAELDLPDNFDELLATVIREDAERKRKDESGRKALEKVGE